MSDYEVPPGIGGIDHKYEQHMLEHPKKRKRISFYLSSTFYILMGLCAIFLIAYLIAPFTVPKSLFYSLTKKADLDGAVDIENLSINKIGPKDSKCGYMLECFAKVPYDIERKNIRPTLISVLTRLYREHPECDWIDIWLYTEGEHGFQIGKGSYRNDKIELMFFIPTDKQLFDTYADNYPFPPVRLPTIEEFTFGCQIDHRYHQVYGDLTLQDNETATKNGLLDRTHYALLNQSKVDRVYKKLSSEFNVDVKEVRRIRELCNAYYDQWDSETLEP